MEERWKWLAVIVAIVGFSTVLSIAAFKEYDSKARIEMEKTKQLELEVERLRLHNK